MNSSLKFILIFCLTSSLARVGSADYLTCRVDYNPSSNVTFRHSIEFWPDYTPLKEWVSERGECPFDVEITYRLFDAQRLRDYDGLAQGVVPVMDLHYFRGKDLSGYFETVKEKGESCSYDSVWFSNPSRFHAFHGFKLSTHDSHHNYTYLSYAAVPFVRHVDAVFIDERNWNTVYVSNNWYYEFEYHGRYVKQGRLGDLFAGLPLQKGYVDSVLTTRNNSICLLLDGRIQCHLFDHVTRRYTRGDVAPRPFGEAYRGGNPKFPFKGSFWIRRSNETAFLDSDDTFWVYDADDEFSYSKPFCDFMEFGRLHCCTVRNASGSVVVDGDDNAAVAAAAAAPEETTEIPRENGGQERHSVGAKNETIVEKEEGAEDNFETQVGHETPVEEKLFDSAVVNETLAVEENAEEKQNILRHKTTATDLAKGADDDEEEAEGNAAAELKNFIASVIGAFAL